jgi:hypothetical protein
MCELLSRNSETLTLSTRVHTSLLPPPAQDLRLNPEQQGFPSLPPPPQVFGFIHASHVFPPYRLLYIPAKMVSKISTLLGPGGCGSGQLHFAADVDTHLTYFLSHPNDVRQLYLSYYPYIP